jgi:transcriptional regulator with XRE-family HTH domain
MDWKQLIADLLEAGMTQQEIADRCGSKQTTISEIARGVTADPRYALGEKLRRLHARKLAKRTKTPA